MTDIKMITVNKQYTGNTYIVLKALAVTESEKMGNMDNEV